MFGAGGGTSSYEETRNADLIILWGSNAREAHPIFFHHVLKAVHRGAKLIVVDPRRTASAQWADLWLGIDVGTDIPLANAVGREIIASGLVNEEFVARATTGYEEYRESVEPWTLDEAERVTGVPADAIRELAHAYANAGRAQLCWTLGITEHHNAVDNVFALIDLALLTGHVGRYGSGLSPLRGQNNVQGGGDMGALPNKLPGFQDVEDDAARARFEEAWDVQIPPRNGKHLSQMFHAMESGELRALYVIGENPAQSEADQKHAIELLEGLDHLVVQDIFLTKTAQLADVVLPASASWAEAEGTVTSSERRVQRVRKALDPPGEARDDVEIVYELGKRLGVDLGSPRAEDVWNELRSLSPMHAGMSYARLEELGGIPWPCWDETQRGRAVPARTTLGRRGRGARAVQRRCCTTRRSTCSTTTFRSASRPGGASSRSTPACRPAASALRSTAAARRSGSHRRTARATASPTAAVCASCHGAARSRRRRPTTTRCVRGSRS